MSTPTCNPFPLTLKKYTELLRVESKVKDNFPGKFALVIDGCSKSSLHYVGAFASYGSNSPTSYSTVLSFSPMFSETSSTATDHYEFLEWVFSLYSKSFENVAIIGDNVSTNKALANMCSKSLLGCASYRFNLAMKKMLTPNAAEITY